MHDIFHEITQRKYLIGINLLKRNMVKYKNIFDVLPKQKLRLFFFLV